MSMEIGWPRPEDHTLPIVWQPLPCGCWTAGEGCDQLNEAGCSEGRYLDAARGWARLAYFGAKHPVSLPERNAMIAAERRYERHFERHPAPPVWETIKEVVRILGTTIGALFALYILVLAGEALFQ